MSEFNIPLQASRSSLTVGGQPQRAAMNQTRKPMVIRAMRFLAPFALLLAGESSYAASVTFEAESGALGTDWAVSNSVSPAYVTILSNSAGSNPSNTTRVASYSITFPEAGTYQLYARLQTGSGTFNDDSLFLGNGFGAKSPTLNSDWVLANGLAGVGFTGSNDVVTGAGTVGSLVWKWVNLSQFVGSGGLTVSAGGLTQTFQVGAREDGLAIDKFVFGTSTNTFTVAALDSGGMGTPPASANVRIPPDVVAGNLIQFNDNGAWCWYQDERAVVDTLAGRLITGSDASGAGVGGAPRNGAVDAVVFDLHTGTVDRTELLPSGILGCDDHNAPAFMMWPDGTCQAQCAGHNQDFFSYFRLLEGNTWLPRTTFDWTGVGAVSGEQASYSNPYYLAAEGRALSFVRCIENRSPHMLVSSNFGSTWTYGGQLVEPDGVVGYNSGYFRYSGNGKDRIDFICTEAHPRDVQTSIYHGYISNGMSFKSDGSVVDTNLFDRICPVSRNFTLVFSNGTVMPQGMTNYRCWNSDVQSYPDGSVQAIIHARINQVASGGYPDTVDPNHAFFFCRYDGTNWTTTYLCQAGYKMYYAEADYVGLGALNPSDPNTIFISTRYDPAAVMPGVFDTNQPCSAVREIWKGFTTNHGASFTWSQITSNSVRDNFRPIVPAWDQDHAALLWFRGAYTAAQSFDASIVGLVEERSKIPGVKTYVDATTNNTTLATGGMLVPDGGSGQWHLRLTNCNGGGVLASADGIAEDAPAIKTTVTVPGLGIYDLWVNFWGNANGGDWRIMAGMATNQVRLFRQVACRTVQPDDHDTTLVLTDGGSNYLYQAYIGRATASVSNTVSVVVDDNAVVTGTISTPGSNTIRTWYDGVSYAKAGVAEALRIRSVARSGVTSATLVWNSTPLQSLLPPMTFTVQKKSTLSDAAWFTLATGIPSNGSTTEFTDDTATTDAAFYRVTSP